MLVAKEMGTDISSLVDWPIRRYIVVRDVIREYYKEQNDQIENEKLTRTLG